MSDRYVKYLFESTDEFIKRVYIERSGDPWKTGWILYNTVENLNDQARKEQLDIHLEVTLDRTIRNHIIEVD